MNTFRFLVIFPFKTNGNELFTLSQELNWQFVWKREREERVHITFCIILSVSLTKNVRSFTWTNPVHLNMFVNLRAIHMCCFLPLPMHFCLIPCRRCFPHPYQIQYLLKKLLGLSPSFACMLGLLLEFRLLPNPTINIKFYLLAFWHFQDLAWFSNTDVSGSKPDKKSKSKEASIQQPLLGLGVFIKKVLVCFHMEEIDSSFSLPDLQRNLFETFFFFQHIPVYLCLPCRNANAGSLH